MLLGVAQANGATVDAALDAGAALEILHNYSLVHDDIEDRDELRHGRPTLWATYGIAQAINAGDAMCALSFLALARAKAHHDPARVLEMIEVLHRAHARMCHGQALDLRFEREAHVDLESYSTMIACKTAALFGAACELGAHCAGADTAAIAAYRDVGIAYGNAFQVYDDVLGIWAGTDATGKMTGVDISRRKWTFPVVWALAQPPSEARTLVADAYGRVEPIDPQEVPRVVAALDELGAREAARRTVAEHLRLVERHPQGGVRELLLGSLDPALV
jgi:geranylgeranyl diphosphate synthase type I